jgi:hypothetical protein
MKSRSGTTHQSALTSQRGDYAHEQIMFPVLGIVLNVFPADDERNSNTGSSADVRASHFQARVLVVNDGSDSPWTLPNVIVPPSGTCGVDNYDEEIPRGTTGTIDDSVLSSSLTSTSLKKLDGDWCIVDFIGGSSNQPFIAKWWPHPANRMDSITAGLKDGNLTQGRRKVKRFQGTRFCITEKGSVLIDTSEANSKLQKGKRVPDPSKTGGDIRVSMKPEREFELNFNPFVFGDPDEPDFLWPPKAVKQERGTANSRLKLTKDELTFIAGAVVNLIAQTGNLVMSTPQGKIQAGKDADEPMLLGNKHKALITEMIDDAIKKLRVNTIFGPSGAVEEFPANVPLLEKVKTDLPGTLSDFAFTRKDAK